MLALLRAGRRAAADEGDPVASASLTPEELQSYWLNGYLLKRGLIDPETVETLRKRFQAR